MNLIRHGSLIAQYLKIGLLFFWDRVILICFILAVSLLGANMDRTEEDDIVQHGAVIAPLYENLSVWLSK
jgi:hypothetical protein